MRTFLDIMMRIGLELLAAVAVSIVPLAILAILWMLIHKINGVH